ncbi:hypothetical protein GGS20DRAFT_588480 [Poronia punctata]|nr:hypothetical protein GGS20DRAFT_588480 [Poronia punctata]
MRFVDVSNAITKPVFTHGAFRPENAIYDAEKDEICMVNWGRAAFMPEYWEHVNTAGKDFVIDRWFTWEFYEELQVIRRLYRGNRCDCGGGFDEGGSKEDEGEEGEDEEEEEGY